MISDQPAASLIPPGMLGHDAGRRWPSMRRDAALAALREAGIQPGTTLAVSIQPLLRDRTALLLAASPKVRGLVLRGTKPYLNCEVGVAVAERVAEARRATGDALILPMFHEQAYRIARPEVDGLTLGLGTPTVSMEELRIVPPGQVT